MSVGKSFPIQRSMPINQNQGLSAEQIKTKQEGRLREAAQMYEEQFLNTLVGQMRKTVPQSDLVKKSYAEKIYQNKLDQNYVKSWVGKGGIGLSDLIYKQMHERIFPDRNVQPPHGPMQIEKSREFFKAENEVPDRDVFRIQESQLPEGEEGVNLIIESEKSGETGNGEAGVPSKTSVVSPWDGEVVGVLKSDFLQQIKIDHGDGLVSQLSYTGSSEPLVQGTKVGAGEKLGLLGDSGKTLHWQVRTKS